MTRTTVGIKEAALETALSKIAFNPLSICALAANQAVANRGRSACAAPILKKEGREREGLKTRFNQGDFKQKPHAKSNHNTSILYSPSASARPIAALPDTHRRYRATSPGPIKVLGLNHFNITASGLLIEQVKRFYTDVIGLTVGPRALLDHEGYWLYAGSVAIVHLSARQTVETAILPSRSYFNHISLSCVGLSLAIAKLKSTCTPYRMIELNNKEQTQLFVTDPAGIGVELTFDECL